MHNRREIGSFYENIAAKYLEKHGYTILERNYHAGRHGEIDIISVLPGKMLVFTEVRSKHNCEYGHPIETIDARKQAHIRKTAEKFLLDNPKYADYACRFDVVTIVGEGKNAELEYFPDAF